MADKWDEQRRYLKREVRHTLRFLAEEYEAIGRRVGMTCEATRLAAAYRAALAELPEVPR